MVAPTEASATLSSPALRGGLRELRCGLRELFHEPRPRFFWGTLVRGKDGFLLRQAGDGEPLPMRFSFPVDHRLECQLVSVLGYPDLASPIDAAPACSILVEKFVTHQAIAARAFAIHQSTESGGADENWLRAERELLCAEAHGL